MVELGGHGAFYRFARVVVLGAGCLALAHCSSGIGRIDPRYGVSASPRVVPLGERAPKGGGIYKVGKPYTIAGRTYMPDGDPSNYHAVGYASWYGDDFHGRYTANGEIFDEQSISAASPVLPLPSYARVTNLANHRSIVVRVNDRGPYAKDRILDVSRKTAKLLGFYDHGVTKVRVDYIGRAPLSGSSDRELMATLREHAPNEARPVQVASAMRDTYFDARSLRDVLPPERPYGADADSGHDEVVADADLAPSHAPTFELAANATPQPAIDRIKQIPMPPAAPSMAAEQQISTARVSPVSAYASMSYDDQDAGFMSGRGLY